jgi:hypothetical protein
VNLKAVLLLVGLLVGGVIGYLTLPEVASIELGDVAIQVNDAGTSNDRLFRITLFAIVGGLVGLALGFFADQRR